MNLHVKGLNSLICPGFLIQHMWDVRLCRLIYTSTIEMTMEGLDLLRTGSLMGMIVEEEVTIAWSDLKFSLLARALSLSEPQRMETQFSIQWVLNRSKQMKN